MPFLPSTVNNSILNNTQRQTANTGQTSGLPRVNSPMSSGVDNRIRLRPLSQSAWDIIFGAAGDTSNILNVLHPATGITNGLIFPYTPSINYSYNGEWKSFDLVHTNFEPLSYAKSNITDINISGLFTCQDSHEATYSAAAIHFFRTMVKMYYGSGKQYSGSPPPSVLLSGYGSIFNDIPVVVKSFTHDLPTDVDYVDVPIRGGASYMTIPVAFNISVTLGIQPNLKRVRDEFDLNKFRTGELLVGNGKFNGRI